MDLKNQLEKWLSICKNRKLDRYLTSCIKIRSRWVKVSNIRQNTKSSVENRCEYALDLEN